MTTPSLATFIIAGQSQPGNGRRASIPLGPRLQREVLQGFQIDALRQCRVSARGECARTSAFSLKRTAALQRDRSFESIDSTL